MSAVVKGPGRTNRSTRTTAEALRKGARQSSLGLCAALAVALASCTDATDVERIEISVGGAVGGQVYLDLNGSGGPDGGDDPIPQAGVVLSTAAGDATVAETVTDDEGVFVFDEVPVGTYTVSIDADVLGDSLVAVEEREPLQVTRDEATEIVLGATFPELTVEEARAAEPGRKVFTTGISLNQRLSFSRSHQVFLEGESEYLQATNVAREPTVAVGDSVRFLGRTAVRHGQPVLDEVTPFVLVERVQIPISVDVSTAEAANARDGALDAALVRIRSADVSDTMTVSTTGDFHFMADDGSGPVEVVLRSYLEFGDERPGDGDLVEDAVGLLSPHDDGSGTVRWRLLVRSESELAVEAAPDDAS